jgi:uncharacterized iron-regulated membrane protein
MRYHPRRIWIRRINFQIHLWLGIILSLYLIVMGVTGSILVFQGELETLFGLLPWHEVKAQRPFAPIATVIRNVETAYPNVHIASITAPTERQPVYSAVLAAGARITVALDPNTGRVLGEFHKTTTWLDIVDQLHVSLFVPRNGRIPNGIGGALVLLMVLTGLINWWRGTRNWTRGLKVAFRRSWRRINFDLHSAVGFWMAAMIVMWAGSAIYFAWPRQIFRLVNRVSPIITAKPPVVNITARNGLGDLDLDRLIATASALDPGAEFRSILFPFSRRAPIEILMRRWHGAGRVYEDTLYFDPYTGAHVFTWQYGVNKSLGDWFIWLQGPMHFGIYWGLGVKIAWAIAGLAIPTLAVTGLVMYWYRVLRKKQIRVQPQFPRT